MLLTVPPIAPRTLRRYLPELGLLLAGCYRPAWAGELIDGGEARSLAGEVLGRAGSGGPDGLGDWTRSVIEKA